MRTCRSAICATVLPISTWHSARSRRDCPHVPISSERSRSAVSVTLCGVHHAAFDTRLFTEVFVTLLVIMDPIGTVPLFLALTSGRSRKVRQRQAWQAVVVALSVITTFALFGQQILRYLDISVAALQ